MKTHNIVGFALIESHGDGVGESRAAIVTNEDDAKAWTKESSPGWRRYKPYNDTINVYDNLAELRLAEKETSLYAVLATLTAAQVQVLKDFKLEIPHETKN